MNRLCGIGLHAWAGCTCKRCQKTRGKASLLSIQPYPATVAAHAICIWRELANSLGPALPSLGSLRANAVSRRIGATLEQGESAWHGSPKM